MSGKTLNHRLKAYIKFDIKFNQETTDNCGHREALLCFRVKLTGVSSLGRERKKESECKQSNLRKRCSVTIQTKTTINLHY